MAASHPRFHPPSYVAAAAVGLCLLLDGLARPAGALGPPASVEAAARGPNEVRVYWQPSLGATRYVISRDGQTIGEAGPDARVYTDQTASPGRTYRYTVSAEDTAGAVVAGNTYLERTYPADTPEVRCDVLVVGGNAAGISAAVVAARYGLNVALTEATRRLGGMCANGLGASDIRRVAHSSGFFEEFRQRVRALYGGGDGLRYEPRVAQQAIKELVWAEPTLSVYREVRPIRVRRDGRRVASVLCEDVRTGRRVVFASRLVVDATECGDVAAWAGARATIGREARTEREPHAGHILYDRAGDRILPGSTGRADRRLQAYAYLMTVKDYGPGADRTLPPPPGYDPRRYEHAPRWERSWAVTSGKLPGGKFEINQHPQGSDLQEVNYGYPTSSYAGRAWIEQAYRDHALGYLYYIQTVEGRRNIGLSEDDYRDTDGWPSLLYIREARRFEADQRMDEADIVRARDSARANAIGIADYALDSHATQVKRDWSTPDMGEGEFYLPKYTPWHQVPYHIMVPRDLDNVFVPTAVSATHVAYGTYRLEPVRMHFGTAAGVAAYLSLRFDRTPNDLPVRQVQEELLKTRAPSETRPASAGIGGAGALRCPAYLYMFEDMAPEARQFARVQWLGARGMFPCPAPAQRTPTSQLAAAPFRPGDPATVAESDAALEWLQMRRAAVEVGSPTVTVARTSGGERETRGALAVKLVEIMGWRSSSSENRYVDLAPGSRAASVAAALREQWIDSVLWDGADAVAADGRLHFRAEAPVTRAQLAQLMFLASLHIGPVWDDHPLDRPRGR